MSDTAPDLMTLAEVSDMTRVSKGTLQNWRSQGRGPAGFRLGRTVVYDRQDVLRWIAERRSSDRMNDRAS